VFPLTTFFAAQAPVALLGVVAVLCVTFLLALLIAVHGTTPAQRPAVLRAFAQILPRRRR
jgi:site-specific recombinase